MTTTRPWKESLQRIKEATQRLVNGLNEVAKKWAKLCKNIAIHSYTGSPRVKHLALHGRKARTRKKNYHRILKENRRNQ